MKIGILSDTHNHIPNLQIALETFREHNVSRLIHCGDISTAPVIELFTGWDVVFVFGNSDYNHNELIAAAKAIGVTAPQYKREVEVDGKLIGVTHGADQGLLYGLIMCGKYVYVCHGHTHQRRDEFRRPYNVRVINPGALGGSQPETRSVCILDTDSSEVRFIEFPTLS